MDKAPYLAAVQLLSGEYPGDKYRELHLIATMIMDNKEEREEFVKTGSSKRVQPALLPYLRIVFGSKFHIDEFVVEGLKSDDVTIVKQALSARWFFSSSSPLIEVKHFVENVVPQVSMRTRLELMKILALSLLEDPRKAEQFFDIFADRYGVEQTLPLMVACGEEYIYAAMIRRRIVLPKRILTALFRRYPEVVIRYLRLGNEKCQANETDRKLHRIDLGNYVSFLPQLVKRHISVFIELYECLKPYEQKVKLGSTRADAFVKSEIQTLIKNPRTFLDIVPLKLVCNKLSSQQFEEMFEKLLPENIREFNVSNLIKYLQYYPQEKKLELLRSAYKKRYNKELLDDTTTIFSAKEFYNLMPAKEIEQRARKFVKHFEGQSEYYEKVCYLPPSESVPILREKISKTSDLWLRAQHIEDMIISCSLYNSKADLLEVLQYYNTRHKNEQPVVLQQILGSLIQRFDITKLDEAHWQVLKDIIQRSYIKGDLNNAPTITYVPLFSGALHYYIKRQEANSQEDVMFLDRLVRIIIELFFEQNMKWDFINDLADLGRDWLCKFLEMIPQIYSEKDAAWNKYDNKMFLAMYLVRAMQGLNEKGVVRKRKHKKASATTSDSKEGRPRPTRFTIRDYDWLKNLVRDVLKSPNQKNTREYRLTLRRFVKILRQHDAEFYQTLIDEHEELTNDVQSEDALLLLKRNHNKILDKWKQYLEVCRQSVQYSRRSTQRFIISTKWHHELPIRFVEECTAQLEVKGYAIILGLLLKGEELTKLITPYMPKESQINVDHEHAKRTYEITASLPKAMILANPPVSFDVLMSFCQGDYLAVSLQSLTSVGQRTPVHKVLASIKHDISNKPITVKKHIIHLVFRMATRSESRDFLRYLWNKERNHSVREVLAKMILDMFKKSTSPDSWTLLKVCIEGLTSADLSVFPSFEELKQIHTDYITSYLQEFINKLDSFTIEEFCEDSRLEHFQSIACAIDSELIRHLPEELVQNIVGRYPLRYTPSFTIGVYLFSNEEQFKTRLKSLIKIILQELKQFDVPDAEAPRCCSKNRDVRKFFTEVVGYVYRENKKDTPRYLDLVTEMLSLFKSPLRPWKELRGYIDLCLCKDYLEVNTPNEFGEKCDATAEQLVKECKSELVLAQFSEVLIKVLQNDCVYDKYDKLNYKLTVIESMMKVNRRRGALIGIKLLTHFEASRYDARYDEFMKTWRTSDDPMVQAVLSEFVNTNNKLYHGAGISTPMRYLSLH